MGGEEVFGEGCCIRGVWTEQMIVAADAEEEAETNSKCWRWRRTSGSKIFSAFSTVCDFECFPYFDERLNQGAGARGDLFVDGGMQCRFILSNFEEGRLSIAKKLQQVLCVVVAIMARIWYVQIWAVFIMLSFSDLF